MSNKTRNFDEDGDNPLHEPCEISLSGSSEIVPHSPEVLRAALALRDQYLRNLERSKELRRQRSKPHPDASADSSDSAPTNGS